MWDHAMNTFKYICIFSACLLTACAPHKIEPEFPPSEKTQPLALDEPLPISKSKTTTTSAATVSSWKISGAMAAKSKRKGWSASLNWVQQGIHQYQIRLFGPLGGGTIVIAKQGGEVTYTDGPKKISSRNADELLMQQTGIQLPVNNLYYWVRGLPAPGAVQSSHTDKNGNLESLTQAGYSIHYTNYTSVNHVNLPGKIQLQGHGSMIKLVIKRWSI